MENWVSCQSLNIEKRQPPSAGNVSSLPTRKQHLLKPILALLVIIEHTSGFWYLSRVYADKLLCIHQKCACKGVTQVSKMVKYPVDRRTGRPAVMVAHWAHPIEVELIAHRIPSSTQWPVILFQVLKTSSIPCCVALSANMLAPQRCCLGMWPWSLGSIHLWRLWLDFLVWEMPWMLN